MFFDIEFNIKITYIHICIQLYIENNINNLHNPHKQMQMCKYFTFTTLALAAAAVGNEFHEKAKLNTFFILQKALLLRPPQLIINNINIISISRF